MSIDVTYYSFSPGRADKNWENFVKDIVALREFRLADKLKSQAKEEYDKNIAPTLTKLSESVDRIRKAMYDYFDKRGYLIPWVEWDQEVGTNKFGDVCIMTDDDKISYLKSCGCVYKRGTDFKNKNRDYLMLDRETQEWKNYQRFVDEYNEVKYGYNGSVAELALAAISIFRLHRIRQSSADFSFKYASSFLIRFARKLKISPKS